MSIEPDLPSAPARAEEWPSRGLAVGTIGLFTLVRPDVGRGYACEPLILGGRTIDEAARPDGTTTPACESGECEATVAVSATVAVAGAALVAAQEGARPTAGHHQPTPSSAAS